MSCKFACVCSGLCIGCQSREPETYFGEAEDLADRASGRTKQSVYPLGYSPEDDYEEQT